MLAAHTSDQVEMRRFDSIHSRDPSLEAQEVATVAGIALYGLGTKIGLRKRSREHTEIECGFLPYFQGIKDRYS
jgi:hypothetical protein